MGDISDYIRVSINRFRAVESADISLNGITVLAGTNGTGKSTISQLAYRIIKYANDYEKLAIQETAFHLEKYSDILHSFLFALDSASRNESFYYDTMAKLNIDTISDLDVYELTVDSLCARFVEYYNSNNGNAIESDPRITRLFRMMIRTMDLSVDTTLDDALQIMKERIHQRIEIGRKKIRERPSQVLNNRLRDAFKESVNDKVSVYEYGDILFGQNTPFVPLPHFIHEVFYINTPFCLGNYGNDIWEDLNLALTSDNSNQLDLRLSHYISDDIIQGDIRYDATDHAPKFLFIDKMGRETDIENCATGIKSFAIIQILLKNGYVNRDTLLILDEPEAHLHPQWVVEYARLIVLMHKSLGVNFLISSHSTDMVSALRYISEAEGCLDSLGFYCAVDKSNGREGYYFEDIGTDIEMIFSSFNKSFDKLNHYAHP